MGLICTRIAQAAGVLAALSGIGIGCNALWGLDELDYRAGIKDAGNVFGAHGGALDRLDAVIFTVVAGYYVWVSLPH